RRARIAELRRIPATLVLFESGPRLTGALTELADSLGAREAAVCRELTKLHEEGRRGDLATLAREMAAAPEPRRESALVIAPPDSQERMVEGEELDGLLRQALERHSVKAAVAEVAAVTGLPRRSVYQRALALSTEHGRDR